MTIKHVLNVLGFHQNHRYDTDGDLLIEVHKLSDVWLKDYVMADTWVKATLDGDESFFDNLTDVQIQVAFQEWKDSL